MSLSRYQRKRMDELDLFPGDILRINSELEPGWWIGEIVLPVDGDNRKGQVIILSAVIFFFIQKTIELHQFSMSKYRKFHTSN
jgi:hypothetical protein